jgi:hypothetical protein
MIITRPELTEAAPYYFTYIDQVGDTGVIETLRSQLDEFVGSPKRHRCTVTRQGNGVSERS